MHLSHKAHSFPASFPPQLPRKFISELTDPDDVILDPMMGSGTTVLEAYFLGRQAIGFDIDPLAILLARTKTASFNTAELLSVGNRILQEAKDRVNRNLAVLVRKKPDGLMTKPLNLSIIGLLMKFK